MDVATSYTTKAVMVVPMKDAQGKLLGVVQILNKVTDGPTNSAAFSR
jgi:hypothetical protein